MDEGVGSSLAQARERRGIDLERVEADTKIRVRYLRAIEAEEWDALPSETYARAFLRTYADYLSLDAERLAEQQRRDRGEARPGEGLQRVDARPARRLDREPRGRVSPRLLAAIVSAGLVAVLIAIGILAGGGSGGGHGVARSGRQHGSHHQSAPPPAVPPARRSGHTLHLVADAEVWVCLLDGGGETLVDGRILAPGASEGPFRSGSFTVSLGNGEVTMTVDGKQAQIPPTSSPIGFSVTGGQLQRLSEGERPTCT